MAQLRDIAAMREAVENITQILAGRGIKVTQRGSKAFVQADERTCEVLRVNLPYIPDGASDELISAIQGFLDHEVAHVLYTDWAVVRAAKHKGPQIYELHNIIEDTYIERMMCGRFRGSAENLDRVGEFYLSKFVMPRVAEAEAEGNQAKLISVLLVSAIRAWAGQSVFEAFMRDKWEALEAITKRIGADLIAEVAKVKSSADALALAEKITAKIKNPECKGGEDGPKKPGKGDSKKSKPKPGDEESGSEGKDKSKPKPKSEEDEPEESEGEDEEKPESKPEEGEEESKPEEGEEESEPEEGEEESEPEEGEEESEEPEPEEESEEDEGYGPGAEEDEGEEEDEDEDYGPEEDEGESEGLSGEEKDEVAKAMDALSGDFDDAVSEVITGDSVKMAESADYLPFTKDLDVIEPFELDSGWRDSYLTDVEDKTAAMVGPLQKNLERLIAAKTRGSQASVPVISMRPLCFASSPAITGCSAAARR